MSQYADAQLIPSRLVASAVLMSKKHATQWALAAVVKTVQSPRL